MQHVKKLPGFRSGSRRNAVIASVVYALVALTIAGALIGGGDDGANDSAAEVIAPTATVTATAVAITATSTAEPAATATEASGRPEISPAAIDDAVSFMEEDPLVTDAAVNVDGESVALALQVNPAMTPDAARERLDSFARYLAGVVSREHGLRSPGVDDLGGLWDSYWLEVGAGPDLDTFIARGTKAPDGREILWQ